MRENIATCLPMTRFLKQNSTFLILLLCFGIFRTAVADWNTVPSGSMRPTILEGDVVEMQNEVVFVNGVAAEYKSPTQVVERLEGGGTTTGLRTTEKLAGREHAVQFLPERPAARSFGPYVVPQDHYFFLGGGRPDLRYIGPVARKLLIGRANHIVVSADILNNWAPRFGRTGEKIR